MHMYPLVFLVNNRCHEDMHYLLLPFIITFSPRNFSLKSLKEMDHLLIMCQVSFDSYFSHKFKLCITVIINLIYRE